MDSLAEIPTIELEEELSRRQQEESIKAYENYEKARLDFTRKVVKKIHEIDKTIPIVIYDPKKHKNWRIRLNDNTDISITTGYHGCFYRWNLKSHISLDIEENIDNMANRFIEHYNGNVDIIGERPDIKNKKRDFYFIYRFDTGTVNKSCSSSYFEEIIVTVSFVSYRVCRRDEIIKEIK